MINISQNQLFLVFDFTKNDTIYDNPIDTATPADVAINPPPIAPNKPLEVAPSIAPRARAFPKPVIGNVAPAPAHSTK